MGLRARILAVVAETGPRPMAMLRGLARTPVQREQAEKVVEEMVSAGELVKVSDKRWTQYGVPKRRKG